MSNNKNNQNNPDNHSKKWLNGMANSNGHNGNLNITYDYFTNRDALEKMFSEQPDPNDTTYLEWFHRELQYWTYFFSFYDRKTNKKINSLERIKPYIIERLYRVGICAVEPITKEQIKVYDITWYNENAEREITKAQGTMYIHNFGFNVMSKGIDGKLGKKDDDIKKINKNNNEKKAGEKDGEKDGDGVNSPKELLYENTAFIRTGVFGVPWAFGLEAYQKRAWARQKSLDINNINARNTKAVIPSEMSELKSQDIKEVQKNDKNFIVLSDIDKILDLSVVNQSDIMWNDYKNLEKMFEKHRGIRTNISEKTERNTAGEITNDTFQFKVIENSKRVVLEYLIKQINEILKTDWYVKDIIQILEEEEMEQIVEEAKRIKENELELEAKFAPVGVDKPEPETEPEPEPKPKKNKLFGGKK